MRDNELPDHLLYPCPFLYGIRTPDGTAWLDIYCVDPDRDKLKHGRVAALNRDNPDGSGRYETVPLYTLDQVEAMLASQKDEILTRQRRHDISRQSRLCPHSFRLNSLRP